MATKKYLSTREVVKLSGLTPAEVYALAQNGTLPAHKAKKSGWRFEQEAVLKYFGIEPVQKVAKKATPHDSEWLSRPTARKYLHCDKATLEHLIQSGEIEAKQLKEEGNKWKVSRKSIEQFIEKNGPIPTTRTILITGSNNYDMVIERVCQAKSTVKIMTANFKRFNLKPTAQQGEKYSDGTPFVKYLMAKALQGVSVRIICSQPSAAFESEWKEYYEQMHPKLFEYRFCARNHAKVIIVDDNTAYIGSANITPAGLGQGIISPGNIEAGILSSDSVLVHEALKLFGNAWEGDYCVKCHRKDSESACFGKE